MADGYGPPKVDFSWLANLPGSIEAGAQLGRQYTARREIAKCQPGDFGCMSKVLMGLDPAEGVKALQLQNQLRHEGVMENIAQQTANTGESIRTDTLNLKKSEYAGPLNLVRSSLPAYAEARKAILTPGVGGAWETAYGPARSTLTTMAAAIARAHGLDPKTFIENTVPSGLESVDAKRQKLQLLESYAAGLGDVAESLGLGSRGDFAIPPLQDMNTTVAPQGGAPVQAGAVPGYPGEPPTQSIPGERVPEGVDPALWAVMTPQEKALWTSQ